ncbi:hypothetical protein, partial [Treponema sp. R80B11-R83G3]
TGNAVFIFFALCPMNRNTLNAFIAIIKYSSFALNFPDGSRSISCGFRLRRKHCGSFSPAKAWQGSMGDQHS